MSQRIGMTEQDAISFILSNCRARDRKEIAATMSQETVELAVREMWPGREWGEIFYDALGLPACFIMFHAITPVALTASLIATDSWRDVAPRVIRWGLKLFKPQALEAGFLRVECRAMAGHTDAIWMLERLGFTLEAFVPDFGRDGQLFLQYAWRRRDHVHLSEAPKAISAHANPAKG